MAMSSMSVRSLRHLGAAMALTGLASVLNAQSAFRPTASDSAVFRRVAQMVNAGQALAARAVIDSVITAAKDGSPILPDGLYWRAVFSDSPEQARRDYLRITVEFAQSPRAEWALLRLAQTEIARGGRAAAKRYLERLLLDHPEGATRTHAQFLIGRVLLEEGAVARGCASLAESKQLAAPTEIELLNQIAYAQRGCGGSAIAADSVRLDSLRADSARAEVQRSAVAGHWTVQLAAYQVLGDAERLSAKMTARGYDVRVTADRPYRVRIGRFATRAEAVAIVEKLQALQITAIVTEAEKP